MVKNTSSFASPTSSPSSLTESDAIAAALGGRCPLTIAAAPDQGDFESGSDSKSQVVLSAGVLPVLTQIAPDSGAIRSVG